MNSSQKKTLEDILANPISKTLEWRRIEALLIAIGCKALEGNGSRVKFEKDGIIATFHRPHPAKEAKPYQVRDARKFLEQLGVKE